MASPILAENIKMCAFCKRPPAETESGRLKTCGRCQSVFYCSTECQRNAYGMHKERCQAFARLFAVLQEAKQQYPEFGSQAKIFKKEHRKLSTHLSQMDKGTPPNLAEHLNAAKKTMFNIAPLSGDPQFAEHMRRVGLSFTGVKSLAQMQQHAFQANLAILQNAEELLADIPTGQMDTERLKISQIRESLRNDPNDSQQILSYPVLSDLALKLMQWHLRSQAQK